MTNEQHIENLKKLKSFHNGSYGADIDRAIKVLGQEPKTGHWILDETDNSITCDKCGCLIWANDISNGDAHYCPNCGCRMFEPQEREEV